MALIGSMRQSDREGLGRESATRLIGVSLSARNLPRVLEQNASQAPTQGWGFRGKFQRTTSQEPTIESRRA